MGSPHRTIRAIAVAACLLLWVSGAAGQTPTVQAPAPIPDNASALEGKPTVRVNATTNKATRKKITGADASKLALKVSIVDGHYYWSSRDNQLLTLSTSNGFTYLSSATEPGQYIRFRQIRDKISYVEHVDQDLGSVTYWGELRIVVGK